MSWVQKEIRLNERRRGIKAVACVEMNRASNISRKKGCHLVHKEIVGQLPELKNYKIGMANVFCKSFCKAHATTRLFIYQYALF